MDVDQTALYYFQVTQSFRRKFEKRTSKTRITDWMYSGAVYSSLHLVSCLVVMRIKQRTLSRPAGCSHPSTAAPAPLLPSPRHGSRQYAEGAVG